MITDTDRRGAQVFAVDLAGAFERLGHTVSTVALAPGAQPQGLPLDVLGPSRRSARTLRELRRRMREFDITVAHGSSTLMACALSGRPFVYRQISDTRFWAAGWPRRLRVAAFLRRARHVVALSAGAAAALRAHVWLPASRTTIVPNGVPRAGFGQVSSEERLRARQKLGLSADAFVALYIGALVPEKGVDLAVRAAARAPGVELLVAGGGPEQQSLQTVADRLGAPVQFVGVLEDARVAYAAADVNILPSRGGDSMPATLIEAGMCGLPCIATPVGSIEDIVVDGVTGIVIPVDDDAALCSALGRLKDEPETRRRMGVAAAAHCNTTFDIDVVGTQWASVLAGAVRGARKR